MRIERIHVQRFRSIYDATLECDELTALVGANGAGKSSFLRAIDMFYNPNAKFDQHDFYNSNQDDPIKITLTYCDLSPQEQQAFSRYYHDERLVVEKRIEVSPEGKITQRYYGQIRGNRDFESVRSEDKATNKRNKYNELRQQSAYSALPTASSAAKVDEALAQWEADHPDQCEPIWSEHQFFGFKEVSAAKLEDYTRFLLVPAIRDAAADSVDERGSVVNQLIDLVVRSVLATNQQVGAIKKEVEEKLEEIPQLVTLDTLNSDLNTTMQRFAPNTAIHLNWANMTFRFPEPQVNVHLSEDGYETHIQRTGHGVQRAFIITLLQHLAMSDTSGDKPANQNVASTISDGQSKEVDPEEVSGTAVDQQMNLILAVEEPELFQHPSRQRHFSAILRDLASGSIPGVAKRTQILYCTHSPLFVDIDTFSQVRLIYKADADQPDLPKQSTARMVSRTRVQQITRSQAQFAGLLTAEVNEGFFATLVILVEGEGDRAALNAVARLCRRCSLPAHGITIVPVGGKPGIKKPLMIFQEFGIRTYAIWDNDKNKTSTSERDAERSKNRDLLTACGSPEEDWPEGVYDTYAIFSPTLEEVIKSDVTEAGLDWQRLKDEANTNVGSYDLKKHLVVTHFVQTAYQQGCRFPTVEKIIGRVLAVAGVQASVAHSQAAEVHTQ